MQTHAALLCPTLLVWFMMGALQVLATPPPAPPRPPSLILPATARYVSVAEVRELLKGGKLGGIVDVRTPEEVTGTNHLPGARFVNLFVSNFDQSILNLGLDRNRPCLVYCALGGRAARTAARLDALGFKEILVLQGGYEAWRRQSGELGP